MAFAARTLAPWTQLAVGLFPWRQVEGEALSPVVHPNPTLLAPRSHAPVIP